MSDIELGFILGYVVASIIYAILEFICIKMDKRNLKKWVEEEMEEEEKDLIQLDKIEITYTKENTHIENSYLLKTRKAIREEVGKIVFVREAKMYSTRKHKWSYVNEWVAHNRLYRLGLFKSHTKDVDLEENESLIWGVIWFILGGI